MVKEVKCPKCGSADTQRAKYADICHACRHVWETNADPTPSVAKEAMTQPTLTERRKEQIARVLFKSKFSWAWESLPEAHAEFLDLASRIIAKDEATALLEDCKSTLNRQKELLVSMQSICPEGFWRSANAVAGGEIDALLSRLGGENG